MSASRSCPAEEAQPAQRPNTDVVFFQTTVDRSYLPRVVRDLHMGESWSPDGSRQDLTAAL